jgi:hypothetical protein
LACHARLPAPALSQQAAILEAEGLIRRQTQRAVRVLSAAVPAGQAARQAVISIVL